MGLFLVRPYAQVLEGSMQVVRRLARASQNGLHAADAGAAAPKTSVSPETTPLGDGCRGRLVCVVVVAFMVCLFATGVAFCDVVV